MIARICTEDTNQEATRHLITKNFEAFTVYRGMGAWRGQSDASVTIEVAISATDCDSLFRLRVLAVASEIKTMNSQESVLVEFIDSTNIFV